MVTDLPVKGLVPLKTEAVSWPKGAIQGPWRELPSAPM